jgi:Caspase domain
MRIPQRKIAWIAPLLVTVLLRGGLLGHAQAANTQRAVTDVSARPASAGAGYYALIIGVSKYKYLNPLATPGADALSVAKLLRQQYGFQTRILLDVSRREILDALVDYRKMLPPDSSLLIYYAGHGYLDADVSEAYWLPVDARSDNNDNWISADDITRAVRAIASKHVLVISDSCYSGAILGDESGTHRGLRETGGGLALEYAAYLANLQSRVSKDWMASGSREPVEDGGAPGHSVFAQALIQGLTEMRDPQFSATDLFYSYVKRKVGGNSQQLPQYGSIRESGDQLGDFIFSRGGASLSAAGDISIASSDPHSHDPKVTTVADTSTVGGSGPVIGSDVPYTPFDPATEQAAISALLRKYEDARNRRDAKELWQIWPKAPIEKKGPIESYFKNASSIRASLTPSPADLSADHLTATVNGTLHEDYTPRKGPAPPVLNDPITFKLQKSGDGWIIVDVR